LTLAEFLSHHAYRSPAVSHVLTQYNFLTESNLRDTVRRQGLIHGQGSETEHPHVQKDSEICGGDPIIAGTRIPVRLIYLRLQGGDSAEAIQQAYPHLTLAQIHDALSYAYDHLPEIEQEIRREEEAYSQGRSAESA